MSEFLAKQISNYPTFKVDLKTKSIMNLNSVENVNFNEFFEISHILDTSHFNYKVDQDLNIIVLNKK